MGFMRTKEMCNHNSMIDSKKMKHFVNPSSVNMVFTGDLKNMIYLSDSSTDDMDLIGKMVLNETSSSVLIN